MYWKMAVSACRRVSQVRRQINSALIVLKKVSMASMARSEQVPLPLIRCPAADVYIRERGHLKAVFVQDLLVIVRTVLAAPVAVQDTAARRRP